MSTLFHDRIGAKRTPVARGPDSTAPNPSSPIPCDRLNSPAAARLEEYIQSRRSYFEKTYSASAPEMWNSEAAMLRTALDRGDLAGWPPGTDPLNYLAETIAARYQLPDGSYKAPLDTTLFSPELRSLLEDSQEHGTGIKLVWINDTGTIICPHDGNLRYQILSIGVCGCTQVVLASVDSQDTRISVLHYDPTEQTKLLENLEKMAPLHQGGKADVAIIIEYGDNTDLMKITARRALPDSRITVLECDLTAASRDPNDDVLRCRPEPNGTVSVSLKGLACVLLGGYEPIFLAPGWG